MSRRILMIGGGSRGDVQPVVTMGTYLQEKHGLTCTILAGAEFKELIESVGCTAVSLNENFEEIMQNDSDFHEHANAAAEGSEKLEHQTRLMDSIFSDLTTPKIVHRTVSQTKFDLVLITSIHANLAVSLRECFGIPTLVLSLQEVFFDPHGISAMFDPATYSHLTPLQAHWDAYVEFWSSFYSQASVDAIDRGRSVVFGLDRRVSMREHLLVMQAKHPLVETVFAYSKHLLPPSEGFHIEPIGYLFQPPVRQDHAWFGVSEELVRFLDNGAAPIYIGWGSMCCGLEHTDRITRAAVGALKLANKRGVILAGWQKLSMSCLDGDDDLRSYAQQHTMFLERAPHHWLMPRCEALVIHGGAGTVASAVRAGRPIVVSPYAGDQPYHGTRVQDRGIGVRTNSMVSITAESLAEAITTVTASSAYQERAAEMAEKVKAEDGCEALAQKILSLIQRHEEREPKLVGKEELNSVLEQIDLTVVGVQENLHVGGKR